MHWNFWDALTFSGVMAFQDAHREKERQRKQQQRQLQARREKLVDESEKILNWVAQLCSDVSPQHMPEEVYQGISLLPVYLFALVLEKQGFVCGEQRQFLQLYFGSLSLPFSLSEFLEPETGLTRLKAFQETVVLTEEQTGRFWRTLAAMLSRRDSELDFGPLRSACTELLITFNEMQDPFLHAGEAVCQTFCTRLEGLQAEEIQFPKNQLDPDGLQPLAVHLEQLRDLYTALIHQAQSAQPMGMEEEDLLHLFNLALLHSLYTMVSYARQPDSVKRQMIEQGSAILQLPPDPSPEEYIQDLQNDTEDGQTYRNLFSCEPQLGMFWKMLLTMTDSVSQEISAVAIITELSSVLLQLEKVLEQCYGPLASQSAARRYLTCLTGAFAQAVGPDSAAE